MMKKLFFAMIFMVTGLMVTSQTFTVTVSGTVNDINGDNPPIEGQMVFINTDSISGDFFYYNMVVTNPNGYFEDSFDVPTGVTGDLFVSTMGCEGAMLVEEVQFSENNNDFTFSFLTCGDPSGGGDDCEAMFYYYPEDNSMYTIQFMDMSLGFPDTWDWDFGDGGTSTEQNPVYTYDDEGDYYVSLTISSDSLDCTSTVELLVRVGDSIWFPDSCLAMFYTYPDQENFLTMNFMDMSIGINGNPPDSWYWDFGDGTTSNEQNPVHTYSEEGMYEVCLTISTGDICEDTYCEYVEVIDWNNYCEAMFFYYPGNDSANTNGLSIQFIDSSFGNPSEWTWEFGDGTTADGQNPLHTYEEEGMYEVCLTISSEDGECEDTYCEIIEVFNYNEYCQAQFYYYPAVDSFPSGGDYGIQFIDYSFGNPTSWDWDFGDGGASTEQNPLHVYNDEGFYEVCLTIANPADSCESTWCEEIYVFNDTISDCWAWFEYEMDELTVDFEGYLMNSQIGEYTWDFGDGTGGDGQTISHTYGTDGVYTVTLSVADSASGCYTTYTEMLVVGDVPFIVSGYVFLEDSLMADYADVYLMTFDTIGNDLIAIAETEIDANGYYEFDEEVTDYCIYFVQAELTDASAYYGDYLPTYHISALNWWEAMPIFRFYGYDGYPADIFMIPSQGDNSTGDGVIIGTVTNEDGRSVMQDVEILLLNGDSNPLTYDMTNADGLFDFSTLSYGTYIVYTEIVGIETTPVTITLSADNPNANINIVVKNGEALLGIGEPQSAFIEDIGAIYPNPANGNVSLQINMKQSSTVNISIANSYGQQLTNETKRFGTGTQQIRLNTSQLPKGLYFISIQANDGVVHVQKFVKL